ncbi:exodeoxyribonuclease VII large subunit [Pontibacter sp. JAM-7]|uniref:exodeoxyribonuclease VII large subunit n=1 Tax=Pontibacter sp. JAM-7 TaxID=3366581 RepID=UPI003AF5B845
MSDQLHSVPLALSVSELNRQVKNLLERAFLTVQVVGEISNFVRPSSGHWYFTLKDERAQVRCALFRQYNQRLNFTPKQGDRVQVRAKVSLYEGRGDYQLICESIEPEGSGALQLAYEQLKARLQQEGLFDTRHKQPLPSHCRHIGVITSATGAAIHDILTVFKRRFPALPITLYPTAVQGADAAPQICRAIQQAEDHGQCDVLILGRGGGSLEDLWPFNDERVARAVFNCHLPIVSAVGHEVDIVISDLVADLRAPTPSAAAELLSPDKQQLQFRLGQIQQRLRRTTQRYVQVQQQKLNGLRARLRHPGQTLREQSQRLDSLEMRLYRSLSQRLQQQRDRLDRLKARLSYNSPDQQRQRLQIQLATLNRRLERQSQLLLEQKKQRLGMAVARLQMVSPLATLERGYAIITDIQGHVMTTATDAQPGQTLEARLHQGSLTCTVTEINTD